MTWQTDGFGLTGLTVEINGTGIIAGFSFYVSGQTIYRVEDNTDCRTRYRALVCDKLGLQLGYGQQIGVSFKTIDPIQPGTKGDLQLYAGTSPGIAQGSQEG